MYKLFAAVLKVRLEKTLDEKLQKNSTDLERKEAQRMRSNV